MALVMAPAAARATTEQALILSPADGSLTSSPQENPPHHLFVGDWAVDIATDRTSRPVYARFGSPTGALSLSVEEVLSESCRIGGGGARVRVRVFVDGVALGDVWYLHLAQGTTPGVGAIANGQQIGVTASGLAVNTSCWTGIHVHVEPRNLTKYSCFKATGLGARMGGGSVIGVIGGEWAGGVNQICPAAAFNVGGNTPPPPPPARDDVCLIMDAGPTGSGKEELHCTGATGNYGAWTVHTALPWGFQERAKTQHLRGDIDGDRRDEVCLLIDQQAPTGSGKEELHCASAASNWQSFNLHVPLPWAQQQGRHRVQEMLADVDGDGRDDACMFFDRAPTGSGREELHCAGASSNYQAYNLHVALPWGFQDRTKVQHLMGDVDGDGRDDACLLMDQVVPTGSGKEELHCAGASSNYQAFNLHVPLPWAQNQGRGRIQEGLSDIDGDGRDDLCLIHTVAPTGSGKEELHCAGASSNYQAFNMHAALPWGFESNSNRVRTLGSGRAQELLLPAAPVAPTPTTPTTPGAPGGTSGGGTTGLGGGATTPTGSRSSSGPSLCTVPRLAGLSVPAARTKLSRNGCKLGAITYVGRANPRADKVIGVKRRIGVRLGRGAKVGVVVRR